MEGFRPEKLERWSYYLIKQELHHEIEGGLRDERYWKFNFG